MKLLLILVSLVAIFVVAGIIYLGVNPDKSEIIEESDFISNQESSEQDKSVFSDIKCAPNALGNIICRQQ